MTDVPPVQLPMIVDINEPMKEVVPMLAQCIPVHTDKLNIDGFADYFWNAIDGHSIQMERKQNGELLGSLSSVEEQLSRQYDKADENILLIEGFITSTSSGCGTLKTKDGQIYYVDREFKHTSYTQYCAWVYRLDKCGITTYFTDNLRGTATLLIALYRNSMRPEHTTLQRYIKNKIYLENKDPKNVQKGWYIKTLMGINGVNIGEKTATLLIEKYGSPWGVLIQNPETLAENPGIGMSTANSLLKAIGKIK